jgi:ABC-type lipoprotein export system ATPase subunit
MNHRGLAGVSKVENGPLVQVTNVFRMYPRGGEVIRALDGINLTVPKGMFVMLVGPSGGGKSTLLHILGGIDRPTSGSVQINGLALDHISENDLTHFRRDNIGFVFQFYNLLPFISAQENVALPLLAKGWHRSTALKEAEKWLKEVGLDGRKHHKSAELSGGEQQRVAIARAMITSPDLLLADEPTGDLDESSANEVMSLMRNMNRQNGTTCIVATHNLQLIQSTDRVVHLAHGKIAPPIQAETSPAALLFL